MTTPATDGTDPPSAPDCGQPHPAEETIAGWVSAILDSTGDDETLVTDLRDLQWLLTDHANRLGAEVATALFHLRLPGESQAAVATRLGGAGRYAPPIGKDRVGDLLKRGRDLVYGTDPTTAHIPGPVPQNETAPL